MPSTDHRRATAERNAAAILDAAEGLLTRGAPSSMSAVAAAAGVSRVTLYAHFPTREALVEGVVTRVIDRAKAALEDARLDQGPALEALDRLTAIAWDHLDRGGGIARGAADVLTPAAMDRAHRALHEPIGALIARGQASGEFRDDLTVGWLLATYFALMHAAGDQLRAGALASEDAVGVLQPTLRSVFRKV
ncbi:MAG TPA: TetR family transcriptional regulator [Baekduia sp.]|uniref:TetR/AcrR family transcriptional regulator n=1 Tax=Baekduia sp. TaxID=2600305 RepID=UPI002D788A44|nr:TetR family transcriptional regulator [Baekduia sp.]HET6509594.1 TetR family transcriptional regulator [Baekduia sp.]